MATCAQKRMKKVCRRVRIKRGKGRGKMVKRCHCAKKSR